MTACPSRGVFTNVAVTFGYLLLALLLVATGPQPAGLPIRSCGDWLDQEHCTPLLVVYSRGLTTCHINEPVFVVSCTVPVLSLSADFCCKQVCWPFSTTVVTCFHRNSAIGPLFPPRFGEVAHAPPDLAKIPKPRGFKDQGQAKPWARQAAANASGGGRDGGGNGAASDGNRGGGKQHQSLQLQHKNKGRRDNKVAAGGSGEEDGHGLEDGERREEQRQMAAEAKKAQKRQMEEMRQRVQEAYSGLKKKRRAGQTQFVGSDL